MRKHAMWSLFLALVISIPAVLWVSHVAPHWMQELHSNLAVTSARGDLNDPGPSSMGAHTLGMVVSLQTIVSVFRDGAELLQSCHLSHNRAIDPDMGPSNVAVAILNQQDVAGSGRHFGTFASFRIPSHLRCETPIAECSRMCDALGRRWTHALAGSHRQYSRDSVDE